MLLFPKIAGKIVNEVQSVMDEDIIVVDENGVIMASTQKDRIGNFHMGAQKVFQTNKKLYIDEEMAAQMEGVRMGINMPIRFEGRTIGVIGVTGNPKEVEHYAELIRRLTELIIQETVHAEQARSKTRGLEAYFYEWATVKAYDQHFVERGLMLGIPMQVPHICCFLKMAVPPSGETEIFERLQSYIETDRDMIVHWGPGLFLLLKSVEAPFSKERFYGQLEDFKRRFAPNCAVGVGKTAGTYVVRQSFKEAQKALKVAGKNGGIVFYEDLLLDLLIEEVSEEARQEYLQKTIAKLQEHAGLAETLQAYLANNLSLKETAAQLHVHINTLHYRLKQITEVTGIDPKTAEGIALFYLAVHLAE
ncbi:CdaR family transcriptional regulator [Heyndrickxia coagulans]|uniref:CdaR family transcriptional regulator n=1 Tax=Heyndrickxia coagulans TaxID=1398 RepID=UPI002235D193|nr:sugar diacid recognition domain-containing protein [Heyndrickxia coagulans]UZH06605.1 helix-turn-helix domain-containing protein [Heyndrickxia coagulans]